MVNQFLDNSHQKSEKEGLEVFIAYARGQDDEQLLEMLRKQLSPLKQLGFIRIWYDRDISGGTDWKQEIDKHLKSADIILLLLSPDFMASDYCYGIEMQRAMERHAAEEALVIPIILRPVLYQLLEIGKLQALPRNGRAVTNWPNSDDACFDVADGIREKVEEIIKKKASVPKNLGKQKETEKVPSQSPIWEVPHQRNRLFIDYDDVITCLDSLFTSDKETRVPRQCTIVGFGGSGKTQIVLEYAYKYRDRYQTVIWVKADRIETLEREFAAIASKLKLLEKHGSNQYQIIDRVRKWLEQTTDWLLIFDDVHPDIIDIITRDLIPGVGRGNVIFTTTYQALRSIPHRITLRKMTPEEGADFLLIHAGLRDQALPEHKKHAHEISKELDGHPLALAQAGAYLEETHCGLSSYLEIYKRSPVLLYWRGGSGSDRPQSVYNTVSLALERVKERKPNIKSKEQQAKAAAMDLLFFCAFLTSKEISEKIITKGTPNLNPILQTHTHDPNWLNMAVRELLKFSLVQRDPDTKTLTVHSLVQVVIKSKMDEKAKRQWAEQTVEAVNRAFPEIVETSRKGDDFYAQGKYAQAEQHYKDLLLRYQQVLAPDHPYLITCLSKLAHLYSNQGNYTMKEDDDTRAELYANRAQELCQQIWGKGHRETASCWNDRIAIAIAKGAYKQADTLCAEAWDNCRDILVQDGPIRASYLDNLAVLDSLSGIYEQAELRYMQAKAIRERILSGHPSVAVSLNSLGELYYTWGKYAQAEECLIEALDLRRETLAVDHPDLAISLNNLAELYLSMGDFVLVEALCKNAIAICQRSTGEDHPIAASCFHTLAKFYHVNARYKEADQYYKQALKIRAKKPGSEHPSVAANLNDLGRLYCDRYGDLRHHRSARQLCSKVWNICKKTLWPDHPGTAMCLNNLAEISLRMQKYSVAQGFCTEAIEICQRALGREHPFTLQCSANLVRLFCIQGNYAEAEEYYKLDLRNGEHILGSDHPLFATQLSI